MLKLYLKKLLFTSLFFAAYLFMVWAVGVVMLLAFQYSISENKQTVAAAIIALILAFWMVYLMRADRSTHNDAYKKLYMDAYREVTVSFWKDIINTIKSNESIVHTLAFLTLDFLFMLPIGINASSTIPIFIIGTVILLARDGLLFVAVNALNWCLVHRKWLKYRQFSSNGLD